MTTKRREKFANSYCAEDYNMENNDFRYKRTERKILSSYLELKRKDKYPSFDESTRKISTIKKN